MNEWSRGGRRGKTQGAGSCPKTFQRTIRGEGAAAWKELPYTSSVLRTYGVKSTRLLCGSLFYFLAGTLAQISKSHCSPSSVLRVQVCSGTILNACLAQFADKPVSYFSCSLVPYSMWSFFMTCLALPTMETIFRVQWTGQVSTTNDSASPMLLQEETQTIYANAHPHFPYLPDTNLRANDIVQCCLTW